MLNYKASDPFVTCLEEIVLQNPKAVKLAWDELERMESQRLGSKDYIHGPDRNYDEILRKLLTDTHINNVAEVPRLLEWFSKFPLSDKPISDDIAKFLIRTSSLFKDEPCLADILEVIKENRQKYLSASNDNLAIAVIEVLACMHPPQDRDRLKKYYTDLSKIKSFLKNLPDKNELLEKGISCRYIQKICEIFLMRQDNNNPSSALIIVLQLIDQQFWNQYLQEKYVNSIITNINDDRRIINILVILCHWLIQPELPFEDMEYLSAWLTFFIQQLDRCKKKQIVMNVADMVLPSLFLECLKSEKFYEINIHKNVIVYLLGNISNLQDYHKMMVQINAYLRQKTRFDENVKKQNVIVAIGKATWDLQKRFKEHLDSSSCQICEAVDSWIVKYYSTGKRYPIGSASIPEEAEEMEISYPSTSSGIGRRHSGKVGLVNLGNTCYMNSVLQALAMTPQFCHEVLLYKTTTDLSNQAVLKNLQELFALLKYSHRQSLAPTEILHSSRPAYFMLGHQQDSSEFLCHLLDVMYEQEKSALMQNSHSDQNINTKAKIVDVVMAEVEEAGGGSNSPVNDDEMHGKMVRWTTEENLSEGASLERKTQSLADFTQGGELAQTQNGLSDSHSDSTDSGIQSVGGEDSSSSSATPTCLSSYLVHRVFGGELKVTYLCDECNTESHNTDKFRDLQLCFFDDLESNESTSVHELLKRNYLMPEKLTGDNKYRCDKCAGLRDAQRIIKILQAPEHLILTLKHFRYDSESGLRTKLRCKVHYDEQIKLPVFDRDNETYQLYAAVVHSGYSMDYGHYVTYACDSKKRWYKFNDSFVYETTIEEFSRLEPPDTPYILFYKRCTGLPVEDAPEIAALTKRLQEHIELDRQRAANDRHGKFRDRRSAVSFDTGYRKKNNDDDDDQNGQPPSSCRDAMNITGPQHLY